MLGEAEAGKRIDRAVVLAKWDCGDFAKTAAAKDDRKALTAGFGMISRADSGFLG